MQHVTRRQFLKAAGGVAVAGSALGAAAGERPVVIIGAGLAGLAAAYELREAGINVRIAEQSDRAGGRIRTVRDVFDDGAWVDVGGQTSGPGYANVFYYARLFELEFEPQTVFRGRPQVLLDIGDELSAVSALRADPSRWPVALTAEEKAVAPSRLLAHYLAPVAREIGSADRVLDAPFLKYDEMSLLAFLEQAGASPAALRMIAHTANYNRLDSVSALSAIRDAIRALFNSGGEALNLKNGNETLVTAFAGRLAPTLHFNTSLQRIETTDAAIALHFETPDGHETWEAQRVILAIPFTALRRVSIEPELPAERQSIIADLPYTQVAQTYLQTARRFWSEEDNVLAVYSDGPLERLFNASSRLQGERGLLVNWMNGTGAMAVSDMDGEEQAEFAVRELERIWPESRKLVETTYTNDWGKSYAEGAYAHFAPGQMARFAADIPRPIGRLHFAGEHTELVAPGMEGALTSGRRAAKEVIDRLDRV